MMKNVLTAVGLGVAALVVYLLSMAGYVFPGEGAHLMALWHGLDTSATVQYPIMSAFAGLFGYGNAMMPILGAIGATLVYVLVSFFVRTRTVSDDFSEVADSGSRIAGIVASVIFIFTPAVHEAATHVEPRLFAVVWALATFALFIPYLRAPRSIAWLVPQVIAALAAVGAVDSVVFALLLPLYLFVLYGSSRARDGRPFGAVAAFVITFAVVFAIAESAAIGDFRAYVAAGTKMIKSYVRLEGWLLVLLFATIPFLVSLVSSRKAFAEESGIQQWAFHALISVVSILAIATPLSPSSVMRVHGILPVMTSTFAAVVAGYLAGYWWMQFAGSRRHNESLEESVDHGRVIAMIALGALGFIYSVTLIINVFSFDRDRGAFADRLAEKVLARLGDRTWFVTDGSLDDHLRLIAAERGKELNLVCLQRDLDDDYLASLQKLVEEKGLGGEKNSELRLSISLGVLTFVQDWFQWDATASKIAAVWGAPDLWYSAGAKAVPEGFFFGADQSRTCGLTEWQDLASVLTAPEGWGSYRLWKVKDPVEKARLDFRRHLGLVANDYGVYLQDQGKEDEAYRQYEFVLNELDHDNICALFNEFELARLGQVDAAGKKKELEGELKKIVENADRRYRLWSLANYYGYIRSPDIFVRLGYTWARSGRPGEALTHMRRAIDFIPNDRRAEVMNMMAALYANENEARKSRDVYEEVLDSDGNNHDALIGLMRLELMEGNQDKAMEYLVRASTSDATGPRADLEKALLHMMKNEHEDAKKMLKKVTDADRSNLQAWSLMAATTMQQIDGAKDEKVKKTLLKELENEILPTMEKQARSPNDYYVLTTRAFVLMRKGAEFRKEARDALSVAVKDRPDIGATQDIVLGLDISLNDTIDAERQARDILRRNRKAPLANYVMGSLALQNGNILEAEGFLRRSVACEKPISLALNDLAEVLRRTKKFDEAERYARKAIATDENLYVARETLGSILLDRGGDLDEAEKTILKACELSKNKDGKNEDVRMLISLARVQAAKGEKQRAKTTLKKVAGRVKDLSSFEIGEYEELMKRVR